MRTNWPRVCWDRPYSLRLLASLLRNKIISFQVLLIKANHVHGYLCIMMYMWKSENNLKEFIVSFHNVGPSDLGLTDLVENHYLLIHLPGPGSNSDTGVVGMAGWLGMG